jgi:hypothetical protein
MVERAAALDSCASTTPPCTTAAAFQRLRGAASAEGSPNGTPSKVRQFNGVKTAVAAQMKFYDAWGTQFAYNHMAVPCAWAFDTPYKWTKQIPSFFGGLADGVLAFAAAVPEVERARAWRSPGRHGSRTKAAPAGSSTM